MRTAIVPAQITSIEDTIFGNVTLKQFMVLLFILGSGFLFYIVIPPFYKLSVFKIIFGIIIVLAGFFLIWRPGRILSKKFSSLVLKKNEPVFEDKIILERIVLLVQYFLLRPQVYLHVQTERTRENKLLEQPSVPETRTTVVEEARPRQHVTRTIDKRAFPVLVQTTNRVKAELIFEDKYAIYIIGEEGVKRYVDIEKMA